MPLVAFLVLLALCVVFDPTRVHVAWQLPFAVFAAVVVVCASVTEPAMALLLSLCAWLDFNGFVVGTEGTLSWHGNNDGVRLAVLIGCALLTIAARRLHRTRESIRQ
jgi:K+-sensing histidine kinase KdpD